LAIAAIVSIVPTTITVSERTRKRLAAYKRGDSTFDDLLNRLMDEVELEDVMAEDLAEAYRRLHDPKAEWVDGLEVVKWLRGERKTEPPVIRRGPGLGVRSQDGSKGAKGTGKRARRRAATPRRRPA